MNGKSGSDSVQLGCGTLIIIALIVMFFSGSRDTQEVRRKIEDLNQRVERLEQKIDALSERLGPR